MWPNNVNQAGYAQQPAAQAYDPALYAQNAAQMYDPAYAASMAAYYPYSYAPAAAGTVPGVTPAYDAAGNVIYPQAAFQTSSFVQPLAQQSTALGDPQQQQQNEEEEDDDDNYYDDGKGPKITGKRIEMYAVFFPRQFTED